MAIATTIAVQDLKGMLREKETLLWLFVMPFVFFWFLGTVTGGFAGGLDRKDRIGVLLPADAGHLGERLVRQLEQDRFEVVRATEPAALAEFTRKLEVPAAFTDKVLRKERVEVRLLRGLGGDGLAPDHDKIRVATAVYKLLADVVVVTTVREQPLTEAALTGLDAEPRNLQLEVAAAGARKVVPTGFAQAVPGTLVMFTLMILLTGGGVPLVQERRLGLLRRLASAPLTRGEVVLGKALARLSLAVVQIGFGMAIGTFVFGMDWGPDLGMVVVVLAAWGVLCAMLGLLAGNLARSEGQAVAIGIAGSMVLAALGGCWWPIEIVPPWMQALAQCLPTGWTMGAIHQLVSFQNGAGAAVRHVVVLLVAAAVAGWAAARTFRYTG